MYTLGHVHLASHILRIHRTGCMRILKYLVCVCIAMCVHGHLDVVMHSISHRSGSVSFSSCSVKFQEDQAYRAHSHDLIRLTGPILTT
jgi:hypothetical protein